VTDELLFALFESGVDELTVAVFVADVELGTTLNVDVIVTTCSGASVPRLHGNGVVHPPEFETNVRRVGVSSTITFVAEAGPRFFTVIVKVTGPLGGSFDGPDFVIERSALVVTVAIEVELLFATFGSAVDELTDAVFDTVPVAAGETAKMELIVTEAPAARVANEHGNALAHAPLFELKVRPGPGVSFTVTELASDGPLFITVIE
jgi:hypothetical protein